MRDSLDLSSTDDGTLLRVRVTPRSSRTEIDGVQAGALRVRLNAPPVEGAANKSLCEFLAKSIGCRKSAVRIARGERSRDKTVLISGVSTDDVRTVLEG